MGQTLTWNRNALVVGARVTQANDHDEGEAAQLMVRHTRAASLEGEIPLSADKGDDAGECIQALPAIEVAPRVALSKAGRADMPDGLAAREGYAISQQKRKRMAQGFGRGHLIGPIRQVIVRGIKQVGRLMVVTMAADHLVRMRTPSE